MSERLDGNASDLTVGSDEEAAEAALLPADGDRNGSQGEPGVTIQEARLYWLSCSADENELNKPGPALEAFETFKTWYAEVLQQGFVRK